MLSVPFELRLLLAAKPDAEPGRPCRARKSRHWERFELTLGPPEGDAHRVPKQRALEALSDATDGRVGIGPIPSGIRGKVYIYVLDEAVAACKPGFVLVGGGLLEQSALRARRRRQAGTAPRVWGGRPLGSTRALSGGHRLDGSHPPTRPLEPAQRAGRSAFQRISGLELATHVQKC